MALHLGDDGGTRSVACDVELCWRMKGDVNVLRLLQCSNSGSPPAEPVA